MKILPYEFNLFIISFFISISLVKGILVSLLFVLKNQIMYYLLAVYCISYDSNIYEIGVKGN